MAQALGRTGSREGEKQAPSDLQAHLSKYNVPNKVYNLLQQDSITANELSLFRIKDLDNWCDENHLRTIERTRFINAVKSLPNSQANIKPDNVAIIVPVLIGNEEKEQLSQFDEMENNVKNMMNYIDELKNKSNVDKVIEEINNICDNIRSYVETLRQNLLNDVKSMQSTQSQHLSSSSKLFQKLLKMIENTNDKYQKYLSSINNNSKQQSALAKHEIQQEISKCQQRYDKVVSDNVEIISQNNNIVSLNYHMNDIKQSIENKSITINTTKYNHQFIKKFANVKFFTPKDKLYSICQFDSKYTKLSKGSTIDCDNKHIKIGSNNGHGHCYSMILPAAQDVQGLSSGQHCFRMYYKNPSQSNKWLFFGIYKYGIEPKDVHTYSHETSWGIADNGDGNIYCNGTVEHDESNMSFLYSLDENEIDMLIDFDKGILSYSIVDDDVKNREYAFKKKFNGNANIFSFLSKPISYTVHLNFWDTETEVQIAKINVDMFGKNKKLVQWPVKKY